MKNSLLLLLLFTTLASSAQLPTNIICTNPLAESVMLGQYDPSSFGSTVYTAHNIITQGLQASISPNALKENIIKLAGFGNRNTGSDTVSDLRGVGAARRWVYSKFEEYAQASGGRLIPSYLQWTENICSMGQHRNIIAVLPGTDTTDKSIVLIEGHMDSRCEGVCDVTCLAEGVEDNASGTALVMELARVMSQHRYKRTIVFMVTVGEEQSLNGATAFATYAVQKKIKIRAVQNNDVIGGIICGNTSSAPSCPGLNHIDSTQVRIFSAGVANSPHKNYARFIKLQYKEELLPLVSVPMMITVMTAEDRTGRGGDHQPFRMKSFTAVRFTSANEHGNANSSSSSYTDRQHSTDDILGVDTNSDSEIDSFFVDFNYLARNAAINGTAAAMAAIGPRTPTFSLTKGNAMLKVQITSETGYPAYRVGVRTSTNDWDTVYTITSLTDSFPADPGTTYAYSVASVDPDGVESIFSNETGTVATDLLEQSGQKKGIVLLQNKPNPFDEATMISFYVADPSFVKQACITITDVTGKEVKRIPVDIREGMNEVMYEHGYGVTGVFQYTLYINDQPFASKQMVFVAN